MDLIKLAKAELSGQLYAEFLKLEHSNKLTSTVNKALTKLIDLNDTQARDSLFNVLTQFCFSPRDLIYPQEVTYLLFALPVMGDVDLNAILQFIRKDLDITGKSTISLACNYLSNPEDWFNVSTIKARKFLMNFGIKPATLPVKECKNKNIVRLAHFVIKTPWDSKFEKSTLKLSWKEINKFVNNKAVILPFFGIPTSILNELQVVLIKNEVKAKLEKINKDIPIDNNDYAVVHYHTPTDEIFVEFYNYNLSKPFMEFKVTTNKNYPTPLYIDASKIACDELGIKSKAMIDGESYSGS
jgi:hypothetical protein